MNLVRIEGVRSSNPLSSTDREVTFGLGPAVRLSWARTRADVPRVSAETSRAIAYEVSGVWAGRA